MGEVINFELFKGEKELDKDFPNFLANVEMTFDAKTTPDSMYKRIYYTLRYLEGHLRAIKTMRKLGISIPFEKRGKQLLIDWLDNILDQLKGI